jgi:hypothetical protein
VPQVEPIARRWIAEAGLGERIATARPGFAGSRCLPLARRHSAVIAYK